MLNLVGLFEYFENNYVFPLGSFWMILGSYVWMKTVAQAFIFDKTCEWVKPSLLSYFNFGTFCFISHCTKHNLPWGPHDASLNQRFIKPFTFLEMKSTDKHSGVLAYLGC